MCESESNETVLEESPGSKYEGEDILEKELENQHRSPSDLKASPQSIYKLPIESYPVNKLKMFNKKLLLPKYDEEKGEYDFEDMKEEQVFVVFKRTEKSFTYTKNLQDFRDKEA